MMLTLRTCIAIIAYLAVSQSAALEPLPEKPNKQTQVIQISNAWARPTVAAQSVGGGYLTLTNNASKDDELIAVNAKVSKSVELHTMSMDDGVMKMRQVKSIVLPAGKTVTLAPGGLHIMFMGLREGGLKTGESLSATLVFKKAGQVPVVFEVRTQAAANPSKPETATHKSPHKH